jgi:hypothetical protein
VCWAVEIAFEAEGWRGLIDEGGLLWDEIISATVIGVWCGSRNVIQAPYLDKYSQILALILLLYSPSTTNNAINILGEHCGSFSASAFQAEAEKLLTGSSKRDHVTPHPIHQSSCTPLGPPESSGQLTRALRSPYPTRASCSICALD